jgi:hypothetical protein
VAAVERQQRHEVEQRDEQVHRTEHGEQAGHLGRRVDLVGGRDLPAARLAPTMLIGP